LIDAFQEMAEDMHSGYVSEPVITGNCFSIALGMDVPMKGMGRTNMGEICVYETREGKIVKEQFFF